MADFPSPAWRDKNKIGNLMSRLAKHADGEVEMTATQISAAKLFLSKTLPDLQSMELKNEDDKPFKTENKMVVEFVGKDAKI